MNISQRCGQQQSKNIKRLFISEGSYLRRNGKPLIHALSNFFTIDDFDSDNRIM
ncbi:hypothetical protein [Flavobacterium sp. ZS1P14]|uniref:hypothetical protein n=1 Tax=Flavobacterium sp. ZS1P14 TaxID=3401729 RepID=UPI003AAE79BD